MPAGSNYSEFLTPKLFDWVRAALACPPADSYKLEEERALVRHTLGGVIRYYSNLVEELENDSIPEEKREKLFELYLIWGAKIRVAVMEMANIFKRSAEIEAILANKYNGMQVLNVLEQLAEIIEEEVGSEKTAQITRRFEQESRVLIDPARASEADGKMRGLDRDIISMLNSVPSIEQNN